MKWAYGITTVPERLNSYFPITLASLVKAGFDQPRLFIDGSRTGENYKHLGLEITTRYPNIRTHGNWILSLYELYIRHPDAERYAVFQDDFVTYTNLRQYLERIDYPSDGYWNLYTFPLNEKLLEKREQSGGWFESNQRGLGAVALVFDRAATIKMLEAPHMVSRPQSVKKGWRSVDGGIYESMKKSEPSRKELVHSPSLVQHIGELSAMQNKKHAQSTTFRGEEFNALDLLPKEQTLEESNSASS